MKPIAIAFIVLFGSTLLAQDAKTDAVYGKIISEYTLNKDGSSVYHYYKKLKLNTHMSFNRLYGETFIVYNPAYQALKINVCRTTHKDGKVVEAPFNAFNEVLPGFASHAPAHNGLREMVVTHPGLEVGAVVELDYTLSTKPGFQPGLMADEVLTESSPVEDRELIIHVPAGTELNYHVLNTRTSPGIKEDESGMTYTFSFKGLDESSHEGHQPADQTHLPRVFFSTLSFGEAIAFVTGQESFAFTTDEPLKELARKLREENKDDVALTLAVQKLVANDLNTWGIPPQYIGYAMRPAHDTWQSNGGTPCEKTILMAAILREAGINANPVMVVPTKLYDEKTGCLPLAEGILLQVNPRDKEQMYLSAVKYGDQNKVYGLSGKTLLLFEPTKQFVESVSENFENKVVTSGDLVVGDDLSVAGKMEMLLTENVNPYYSFLADSAYAKKLISGGLSGKDITDAGLVNSAQYRTLASLTAEAKKPAREQAGYWFFELPVNKAGTDGWHLNFLPVERTDPFEIPTTIDEEYSYTITLPENLKLINPVPLTERETEFGKLVLSTQQEGNTVTVKRMLALWRPVITPEEYNAFREMMNLWNEKNYRELVLKRGISN